MAAEALAIVAAVSSIVQLIDFTSKVVSRLNDFQSSANDVPKSLAHLKTELPILIHTLLQIHEALDADRFPPECAKAIAPVVEGCNHAIHDLQAILDRIMPMSEDGKVTIIKKTMSSIWKDGKIERITTNLHDHIATLTFFFAASTCMIQASKNTTIQQVRKALSPPDPSENLSKALRLREPQTGIWLLESNVYKTWKTQATFAWLHGIPGCGKTVLSSTVIEDVLSYTRDDAAKASAYFFFDFNDQQKQRPDMMVRSLIAQLLQQCIQVLPSVDALFKTFKRLQIQPSMETLLDTLKELIDHFPSSYIILDAMDECENRRDLMVIIKTLHGWKDQGLHLLLTSRREGDISITLDRLLEPHNIVNIQTKTVDGDIKLYVHERLAKDDTLQKWTVEDKQSMEKSLTEGARGMFRLAACRLDLLRKCRNRRQLLQAMATLPQDLDEMYSRILERIAKEDMVYAIRILRWLAFSMRPLSLAEVAEIVALDIDRDPAFDQDEVLQDPLDVLEICSSLITINMRGNMEPSITRRQSSSTFPHTAYNQVVRLAHYSVKEFLVSDRIFNSRVALYSMKPSICHTFITKGCVHYLLQVTALVGVSLYHAKDYALARYAANYWSRHDNRTTSRGEEILELTCRLFNVEKGRLVYDVWTKLSDIPKTDPPLLNAIRLKKVKIVERLLSRPHEDINVPSSSGRTALDVAVDIGSIEILNLLFQNGAKLLECGGRALRGAARDGYVDVVRCLLDHGAEDNIALQLAAGWGHLSVVQLLVERGADINAHVPVHGTALRSAASRGQLEVVKFLIDKGVDSDAQAGDAIEAASEWGHLPVLELLIKSGTSLGSLGSAWRKRTLEKAYGAHRLDIVSLLIEE